jgi:DNA-binding NtrC family response regulator
MTRAAHRETTAERIIFVVENDWRTRHFICTVLKYSVKAIVIESSNPHNALFLARQLECRIDLLISNIDLGDAKTGMDLAREIVESNPSIRVLLMSGRRRVPPCGIPPAWTFLSIPFPTAAFLNCVSQLCSSLDRPDDSL